MVKQGNVVMGQPIDICVPTGNFGNILAGCYAQEMGLPVGQLYAPLTKITSLRKRYKMAYILVIVHFFGLPALLWISWYLVIRAFFVFVFWK